MLRRAAYAATMSTAILSSGMAMADTWMLDGEASRLAFGSIKKDTVGEVHAFERPSGTVAADDADTLDTGLSSVETTTDIRNERINEHVFLGAPVEMLGRNASGPTLYGSLGDRAGAVDGFDYSSAVEGSDLVWDVQTLTAFPEKLRTVIPGTRMQFAGLSKNSDIENLLAYPVDQ